ncbi:MAG: DUF2796 domain-containing protein [Betaproteobacteria bacterium]|nr:DUF2796 domain-containing protein [Betaproteobacteria bacterium]
MRHCLFPALLAVPLAILWAAPSSAGQGHAAHVHGIAKLEVAVEAGRISLHLESPLEALTGFEHAPRNDQERAVVLAMRKSLAQGDRLFTPTPAARCTLVSARLEAPALDAPPGKGGGHGDLDADFQFRCAQPALLTGLEVRLSATFPRMRRIDAQVVTAKGQFARRLEADKRLLSW